ncbi:hypothetical protein ACFONN_10460 [Dyella humi]|uniref:Uncharacterized protein n=1 Tax=Dyella humi TaxID=1770547 RepID=A0ABW8IJN4_9GAMM
MAKGKTAKQRRLYYSVRTGKVPPYVRRLHIVEVMQAFEKIYSDFQHQGYFLEAFGSPGEHEFAGKLGNVYEHIKIHLNKDRLWPLLENLAFYSEDELFDMFELLADHVSKPVGDVIREKGAVDRYEFYDKREGLKDFRKAINPLLADYGRGYELTVKRHICALPDRGMEPLMAEKIVHPDHTNIVIRVELAKNKFLRRGSTVADHRDAVRDLADVLEFLRDEVKLVLNRNDEKDLFKLANEFGVRHHRQTQKTDYDEEIWLSWMFHYYLGTLHACTRLFEKHKSQGKG